MYKYSNDILNQYIDKTGSFFQDDILSNLELKMLLDNIDPYFFLIRKIEIVNEIIKTLINNYLEDNIQRKLWDWLEGLAIFINNKTYGGKKSGITGIDLEFDNDNIRYIVSIKSGPNWGNSSQIKKMKNDFIAAQKTLLTSNSRLNIRCINGCCYGKNKNINKGTYFKYCGQQFWEFIGGDENIYLDIIEPLGHKAKERNEEYIEQYAQTINKFTKEFANLFCDNDGKINWNKLVEFNSSK